MDVDIDSVTELQLSKIRELKKIGFTQLRIEEKETYTDDGKIYPSLVVSGIIPLIAHVTITGRVLSCAPGFEALGKR